MKKYHSPITIIDGISTKFPYLQAWDNTRFTSEQLTNEHHWEDDMLNEGLDESSFNNTAPKLWDE